MIILPHHPTPIVFPIGGHPFRVFHPEGREELLTAHPQWWWMYQWSSGVLLAHELTKIEEPQTILEIGCGLGLASIVASRGGHTVTTTDLVDETQWFVGLNSRASGTRMPNWVRPEDITDTYDLVVFSDILYLNKNTMGGLVTTLTNTVKDGGRVLCVEPHRWGLVESLIGEMVGNGFTVLEEAYLPPILFPIDSPRIHEGQEFAKLVFEK